MSYGDEMVIRPSITGGADLTLPRGRGKLSRRVGSEFGKRIGRIRLARRRKRLTVLRGAGRVVSAVGRRVGAGSAVRAAAKVTSGPGGRSLKPAGAALTLLAIAAIVTIRVATGRPFEGLSADLNELVLGDVDDEVRASIIVRDQLASNPDLLALVGQRDSMGAQVRRIFADRKRIELLRQRGKSAIIREFPVNKKLDMLILRFVGLFKDAWQRRGGVEVVDQVRSALRQRTAPGGRKLYR